MNESKQQHFDNAICMDMSRKQSWAGFFEENGLPYYSKFAYSCCQIKLDWNTRVSCEAPHQ